MYDIENVLAGKHKGKFFPKINPYNGNWILKLIFLFKGHIEDACYLAKKAIKNEPCGGSDRKSMVIALTNRYFNFYSTQNLNTTFKTDQIANVTSFEKSIKSILRHFFK